MKRVKKKDVYIKVGLTTEQYIYLKDISKKDNKSLSLIMQQLLESKILNKRRHMFNSITIFGNVGNDIDVKLDVGTTKLGVFSVATTDTYKGKDGNFVTRTTWHKVELWGDKVDWYRDRILKGTSIFIEGKQEHTSYTDKNGATKYRSFIRARKIVINSKKDKNNNQGNYNQNNYNNHDVNNNGYDDIPF